MTSTPTDTAEDVEDAKARLKAEFPGWSFIHSDRGRWWAMRDIQRDESGRRFKRAPSGFDADTPDQLRAALSEAGEGQQ
ncbi:hypothetical protein [Actinomadura macra]|uniref:hypothetical protein n=1 Tax=Actinomadura macra TaxID=46164 RepID=UPI000B2E5A83|nr:hypothetical protein [Actinomadura macra]